MNVKILLRLTNKAMISKWLYWNISLSVCLGKVEVSIFALCIRILPSPRPDQIDVSHLSFSFNPFWKPRSLFDKIHFYAALTLPLKHPVSVNRLYCCWVNQWWLLTHDTFNKTPVMRFQHFRKQFWNFRTTLSRTFLDNLLVFIYETEKFLHCWMRTFRHIGIALQRGSHQSYNTSKTSNAKKCSAFSI